MAFVFAAVKKCYQPVVCLRQLHHLQCVITAVRRYSGNFAVNLLFFWRFVQFENVYVTSS